MLETRFSNFDKFVLYLRAFSKSGRMIATPAKAYNKELDDSRTGHGGFVSDSRMGRMSNGAYNKERQNVILLVEKVWDKDGALRPEELLKRMLALDKGTRESYAGKYLKFVFRKQGGTYEVPDEERKKLMSTPSRVLKKLNRLTKGVATLTNPLVGVRRNDDAGTACDFENRDAVLQQLESLSKRLWHMATVIDVETLGARLMLQPSCEEDLQVLETYAQLMGLPESSDATEAEFDEVDFDEPGLFGNLDELPF